MASRPGIPLARVHWALANAEERDGLVLVPAFDVPDHWTRAAPVPWRGQAALNRVGLAEREHLLLPREPAA